MVAAQKKNSGKVLNQSWRQRKKRPVFRGFNRPSFRGTALGSSVPNTLPCKEPGSPKRKKVRKVGSKKVCLGKIVGRLHKVSFVKRNKRSQQGQIVCRFVMMCPWLFYFPLVSFSHSFTRAFWAPFSRLFQSLTFVFSTSSQPWNATICRVHGELRLKKSKSTDKTLEGQRFGHVIISLQVVWRPQSLRCPIGLRWFK